MNTVVHKIDKTPDTVRKFFLNRILKSMEVYNGGKLNGMAKYYNEDGTLDRTMVFVNGIHQGPCLNYWKNGNISTEGYFKNDMLDSVYRLYSATGEMTEEMIYKNGVAVKETYRKKN